MNKKGMEMWQLLMLILMLIILITLLVFVAGAGKETNEFLSWLEWVN